MNGNEQMDRIEKMLRAQLQSAGHVWWIGGYVYGVTSNDDPFIILYPSSDKLNEKVVRVYEHDFKKLPGYIKTDVGGGDTEANPNKEQARKKGIYHECPAFEIVTFDGKDTQMGKERRFGDVLRISKDGREALAGRPQAAQEQPQPRSPQPPPPPPDDEIDWGRTTQPALVDGALPNYRAMALAAKTATEFDYAAFMVLQNGLYTEVGRVTATREVLVPAWRPGERSNEAMLAALTVYRDTRQAEEAQGEATGEAHKTAKKAAVNAYNQAIKSE